MVKGSIKKIKTKVMFWSLVQDPKVLRLLSQKKEKDEIL